MFKLTPYAEQLAAKRDWGHEVLLDMVVGALPAFLSAENPAKAAEQIGHNAPGGPWSPSDDSDWKFNPATNTLTYPGEVYSDEGGDKEPDETYHPLAQFDLPLTKETVLVYQYAWVVIKQEDGSWELDRRD